MVSPLFLFSTTRVFWRMQTTYLLECPKFSICLFVSLWLLHVLLSATFTLSWEGELETSLDFLGEILCCRVVGGACGTVAVGRPCSARLSHCSGSHHLVKGATMRGLHIKATFLFVVRLLWDDELSPWECLASPLFFTHVSSLSSLLHWVCKMELFFPPFR